MKLNKFSLSIGVFLSSFVMLNQAIAADPTPTPSIIGGSGDVSFKGMITEAPCSITPDTANQTVDLGTISSKVLANAGRTASVGFNIKLSDCDISTLKDKTVTAKFVGSPSPKGANFFGISGNAKNASIGILDGQGTPVTQGQATTPTILQDGNNTIVYTAFLQGDSASTAVVPGDFSSTANFTLTYQ